MGTFLGLGLVTTILLKRKRGIWQPNEFDFVKNEKKVKEQLSKLIDVTKYNVEVHEDCMVFEAKIECFNDNIHDLVKDLDPLIGCNRVFDKRPVFDDNFNQDNCPLLLTKEKRYSDRERYYSSWDSREDFSFGEEPEWWLFDDKEFKEKISVQMGYVPLWSDFNKYVGEDPTWMLKIMNKMSRKYFSSSLSRNIFFAIMG